MSLFSSLTQSYPFLELNFLGNSLFAWIQAVLVLVGALLLLKLVQLIVIAKLKKVFEKTATQVDDIVIDSIDSIYWPFYLFASIYVASQFLIVSEAFEKWVFGAFMIIFGYYGVKFLSRLVDFGSKTVIEKKQGDAQNASIVKFIGTFVKIVLWMFAFILLLSNIGFNVNSLIAGLGIGGIAIGLALQNVLGDLFSSLAIYLDKPFKVGDFIIIDNFLGTVKRIGIKTTRIESLQGEEIIMSNSDMTRARISNYGRMKKRRVVFSVGVTYSTSAKNLRLIPEIITKAINDLEITTFDRCHFKAFGDSSYIFETVMYIGSPDFAAYMDAQQAVNLQIVEEFEKRGIEIAFPTRTVYLKKE